MYLVYWGAQWASGLTTNDAIAAGAAHFGNQFVPRYSFIPFLDMDWPGLGTTGCGMRNVNATSDAFDNGCAGHR